MMFASCLVAQAGIVTHGGTTIMMDFVEIGNTGNSNDDTGYGAVDYVYSIGKYEVSQNQWDTVQAHDSGIGSAGVWSGNQPASTTQAFEAWNNAARFANWLTTGDANLGYYSDGTSYDSSPSHGLSHKQYADANGTAYFVPTENEWYKAAYHQNDGDTGNYFNWSTGSDTKPTDVISGTIVGTAVFNGSNVTPTVPADVDQSGGLSPYGTMGQGGNVFEFNEGDWEIGDAGSVNRGRRGGYWGESGWMSVNDRGAMSGTGPTGASAESKRHGFRVTRVIPEPSSFALLMGCLMLSVAGAKRRRTS